MRSLSFIFIYIYMLLRLGMVTYVDFSTGVWSVANEVKGEEDGPA